MIPRTVTLPGDYKVKVRVLNKKEAKLAGMDDADAWWMVEDRTIYLRKSRKGKDRVQDFLHELDHAWTDWRTWFAQAHGCEN